MSIESMFKTFKLDDESAERLLYILEHPKPPVETGHPIHEATPEDIDRMALIINRQGAYEIAIERGDLELAERIKSGEVSDEECFQMGEEYEMDEDDEDM